MEESQSDPERGDDRSLQATESLRALRDQAGQTLDDHRQRVDELEARLNEQLQMVATELTREQQVDKQATTAAAEQAATLDQVQQTLAEKEAEVGELIDEMAAQALKFESLIAERDEELEQLLEIQEEEHQQKAALRQELDAARQALEAWEANPCEQCARHHDELETTNERLQELEGQLHSLQQQHQEQQSDLDETRHTLEAAQEKSQHRQTELEKTLRTSHALREQHRKLGTDFDEAQRALQVVQKQNEQTDAALKKAEQRIAELSKLEQNEEQLEQTRRKFELALADVHKLKRENAELREELQSRPEADDQESPELVSLRAERDALAERVADLENAPPPSTVAGGEEELEDLQRRFELAVDEVRQLKQQNSELQQRLETAPTETSASAGGAAEDWQAQRARLMAALDAEDQGEVDESRREERATIEGTVSITDRVVSEKDNLLAQRQAEIDELKSQIETPPPSEDNEELRNKIAAEILGDDQAIQAERAKLQQQQEQLDAKLREAELEISVQRATLAREQAALEDKMAALCSANSAAERGGPDKPRRRWMSALGINDDDGDGDEPDD